MKLLLLLKDASRAPPCGCLQFCLDSHITSWVTTQPPCVGLMPLIQQRMNKKRHSYHATKMNCDILLMAVIYSASSLDWNDQLAAWNALWSKLSHSLLQGGYHIFIRCVFCNQSQQGVEWSVIKGILLLKKKCHSIVYREKSLWQSDITPSFSGC